MLKCKVWKFVIKHSKLKDHEDPKKLNLELEVEELGSANIVLGMDIRRTIIQVL